MRNAALLLGVIAGAVGMIVGFFSYGYVSFVDWFGPVQDVAEQVQNPALIQATSLGAPILAIAGAALAFRRCAVAGVGGGDVLCVFVQRVHHVSDRHGRARRGAGAQRRRGKAGGLAAGQVGRQRLAGQVRHDLVERHDPGAFLAKAADSDRARRDLGLADRKDHRHLGQ